MNQLLRMIFLITLIQTISLNSCNKPICEVTIEKPYCELPLKGYYENFKYIDFNIFP